MAILNLGPPQGSFSHEAAIKLHPQKRLSLQAPLMKFSFALPKKRFQKRLFLLKKESILLKRQLQIS